MQTPTTAQLRTAIEVFTKLGERLNAHAEHSVMQLSESPLGAHYVGRIEVGALEQTTRIEAVDMQLKNWRDELPLAQPDDRRVVPSAAPFNSTDRLSISSSLNPLDHRLYGCRGEILKCGHSAFRNSGSFLTLPQVF
jgi:hypothetical protein